VDGKCPGKIESSGFVWPRAAAHVYPGEQLAEELKELGMSAAGLARKLGVPTGRVTGILDGQRAVTGDVAFRLAHFFGPPPSFG